MARESEVKVVVNLDDYHQKQLFDNAPAMSILDMLRFAGRIERLQGSPNNQCPSMSKGFSYRTREVSAKQDVARWKSFGITATIESA